MPEDYVDEAERIMRSLMSQPKKVTTSKIRNLLSLVTDIYNEENIRTEEKLRPESVVKLNLMRVRVAYECIGSCQCFLTKNVQRRCCPSHCQSAVPAASAHWPLKK